MSSPRVIAVDNDDSFVHILADEFRRQGCAVEVYRRNWAAADAVATIRGTRPDLLVFSPGPGGPEEATLCLRLLAEFAGTVPIFGVCLGHQAIIHHFGGQVTRARKVVHGKPALVQHARSGLFIGLENPVQVGRYHSLIGSSIPPCLICDAECEGEAMAVRHAELPIWGVQFHPESVLTPAGPRLISNLLRQLELRHAA